MEIKIWFDLDHIIKRTKIGRIAMNYCYFLETQPKRIKLKGNLEKIVYWGYRIIGRLALIYVGIYVFLWQKSLSPEEREKLFSQRD